MARRRRRNLGYRPTTPKRTPTVVYIVLALLCLGGLYISKQNLVKTATGTIVDAYTGQALIGVSVTLTNDKQLARTASVPESFIALTDNTGSFAFTQATDNYKIVAQANNYRTTEIKQSGVQNTLIKLVPTTLRGQVKNENSQPVAHAQVMLGTNSTETATDGSFTFADAPEQGTISVRAPGYRRSAVHFEKTVRIDLSIQSLKVKAVYIAPADIAGPSIFNSIMDSLTPTDATAVMVDIKDESGHVLYDSSLPVAAGAIAGNDKRIPNLSALMKTFQDKKLYTIARIVCFQDPVLTDLKPDWALKSRSTGKLWADGAGYNWINPYQREAWDYYLGLAEEAARAGFDEVQFTGLNFPFLGNLSDIDYRLPEGRTSNATTRMEAISGFLKAARDRLGPLGIYTSMTVFGTALIETGDLGIGMDVPALAAQVDYISPYVFPIEWDPSAFGIDKPSQHPYDLVRQTMLSAQSQLKDRFAQIRPWLQDFNRNNVTYGDKEVRDQIQAIEESQGKNGAGWILYNPNSHYNVAAFTSKK
jgi:hypothetical protein